MNLVVGGSGFSSRLMTSLRSEQGLTYGVYSGYRLRRQPGPFVVSTFTRVPEVRRTLDLLLGELERGQESRIDDGVVMGPSAHLRPGTHLMDGVRLGNFVEIKNSNLGAGVKADHLSYIGDADVGEGASFGCGSITVNYDWKEKHRTTVGPGAVVGCNVNLVAPVSVGRNASIAAGSTITRDVPDGSLALSRSRDEKHVKGWSRRKRPQEKLE